MTVEEHVVEFEQLMLKCDFVELEGNIVARYLGGLKPIISNMV